MRVRLRVSDVLKIVIKRFVMSSNPFPVKCNHLDALNRSRKPTKMEKFRVKSVFKCFKIILYKYTLFSRVDHSPREK